MTSPKDQNPQQQDRYEIFNRNRTIGVSTVPRRRRQRRLPARERSADERTQPDPRDPLRRQRRLHAWPPGRAGTHGSRRGRQRNDGPPRFSVRGPARRPPTAEEYEQYKRETLRY